MESARSFCFLSTPNGDLANRVVGTWLERYHIILHYADDDDNEGEENDCYEQWYEYLFYSPSSANIFVDNYFSIADSVVLRWTKTAMVCLWKFLFSRPKYPNVFFWPLYRGDEDVLLIILHVISSLLGPSTWRESSQAQRRNCRRGWYCIKGVGGGLPTTAKEVF